MIMIRLLKVVHFWIFFPILTFFCVLYICLLNIFYTHILRKDGQYKLHDVSRYWAKGVFFLMPGWNYRVIGGENLPKDGEAMVVVANHESAADIWAICALKFQFRWLSKDAVFKIPGIGYAMRATGHISVTRGNQKSHALALAESAAVIKRGISMLFFPEGTRSETGELRPFKVGAFKLATEQNVKILPVALDGARDLVPKGSTLPGIATVNITILPPVEKEPEESLEEYAARVRGLIIKTLEAGA